MGKTIVVVNDGQHLGIDLFELLAVVFDCGTQEVNDLRHPLAGVGERLVVIHRKAIEILE